ncbi:MAG: hypothetical protein P1U37_18695 [Minwuia sp.]|nr:hypothetical protein [Minwuia sp.]
MTETEADTDESIGIAKGFILHINDYLQGKEQPDPEDTQTPSDCFHIMQDVLAVDADLAAMLCMAALEMSRQVPEQPMWRTVAALCAMAMVREVGRYSPETAAQLDDELGKLHREFPDHAELEQHWYRLICFRIEAETTSEEPAQALETFERLKGLIGDAESISGTNAPNLAMALQMLGLSFLTYGEQHARTWLRDLSVLHERFPESTEVKEARFNTETVIETALETIDQHHRRQNSLFGRLKRTLFGR